MEEPLKSFLADPLNPARLKTWSLVFGFLFVLYLVYGAVTARTTSFPAINRDDKAWTKKSARLDYTKNCRRLLAAGIRKFGGPFTLITDAEDVLMLPPSYVEAVNNEERLSFSAFVQDHYLSDYDTFRTMRQPPAGMFEESVLKGLTRSLPKFTKPISQEMAACLNESWGQCDDWREIVPMEDMLTSIGRLSNRIFLGPDFADNKEWLDVTTNFTAKLFSAISFTRAFPGFLRPIVDIVSPLNRGVRREYSKIVRILGPVLEERHRIIADARAAGVVPDLPNDSIEWVRAASHGRAYSEVDFQMSLILAAIHTTSDLITQTILNLCAHPEYVQPLRQEAVQVLGKHGLQKVALTELRLLDSFLKETQRLKPVAMSCMHRTATADIELPGQVRIRKGDHTAISSYRMWDPTVYQDPEKFDGFRFAERRKIPGYENNSQLVATSPEHLGFAHGKHACPGRFFAANEAKIAMLHILLKYDFEIDNVKDTRWAEVGIVMVTNIKAKIKIRSRTPEVDLDKLAQDL